MIEQPNKKVISRFFSDFKLPIPIAYQEYLPYYLELFDKDYDTKAKYGLFMDFYEKCGGTNEGFFQATSKVLHDAIGRMESTPAYEGFIHADPKELPFFDVPDIFKNVATDKLYHHENDGKMFVSMDMSKANYQAMKFFAGHFDEPREENLVLNSKDFHDFIGKFSDEPYFQETKQFRQALFGHLNPKRQQRLQRYIMGEIFSKTMEKFPNMDTSIVARASSDELVVNVDSFNSQAIVDIQSAFREAAKELHIAVVVNTFTLRQLKPYKFYEKIFQDGSFGIKCVSNNLMPQVYKYCASIKEFSKEDFLFINQDGFLSEFVEHLKFD